MNPAIAPLALAARLAPAASPVPPATGSAAPASSGAVAGDTLQLSAGATPGLEELERFRPHLERAMAYAGKAAQGDRSAKPAASIAFRTATEQAITWEAAATIAEQALKFGFVPEREAALARGQALGGPKLACTWERTSNAGSNAYWLGLAMTYGGMLMAIPTLGASLPVAALGGAVGVAGVGVDAATSRRAVCKPRR